MRAWIIATLVAVGALSVVAAAGAVWWATVARTGRLRDVQRPHAPVVAVFSKPVDVPPVDAAEGARYLLNGQPSAHDNGIYEVAGATLRRAADLRTPKQVLVGALVHCGAVAYVLQTDTAVDASGAKDSLGCAIVWVPLRDLVLGAVEGEHTEGAVLVRAGEGGARWQARATRPRASEEVLHDRWAVAPRQLDVHLVTWQRDWLHADRETLWTLYVYASDMSAVTRCELLVSAADGDARVCVLHTSTVREGATAHIVVQDPKWSTPDTRAVAVSIENASDGDAGFCARLVRVS